MLLLLIGWISCVCCTCDLLCCAQTWLGELATGSQAQMQDRNSLAGQDERSVEEDEYEEVLLVFVCCMYTTLMAVFSH